MEYNFANTVPNIPVSYFVPEITLKIYIFKHYFQNVRYNCLKIKTAARALPPFSHRRNPGSIPDKSFWNIQGEHKVFP